MCDAEAKQCYPSKGLKLQSRMESTTTASGTVASRDLRGKVEGCRPFGIRFWTPPHFLGSRSLGAEHPWSKVFGLEFGVSCSGF